MIRYLDRLLPRSTIVYDPHDIHPEKYINADGYGGKIPQPWLVKVPASAQPWRWRRVYAICYSNAASYYVIVDGREYFIQGHHLEDAGEAKSDGRWSIIV